MQRNHVIRAAVASGTIVGAVSVGYLVADLTSSGGQPAAGQHQASASVSPASTSSPAAGTPAPMPPMPSMPSGPDASPADPSGFSDASLAQFIAQKAGTGLAGRAPQNVPLSQVRALSEQDPAGASVDSQTRTITFYTASVSFTVVAIAPGQPDMTFTVAGLANPTVIVPAGARVTVRFINNDTDEAHGWLVTASQAPFQFGQPSTPAIGGAFAGVIGDPTAAGDGASTITFTAGPAGSYRYICPMPGHAQMGMAGSFTVAPAGQL
jgi:rusticyanin